MQAPSIKIETRIACARCGASFACDPEGACWCKAEPVRLPMPEVDTTCLCPDCLRAAFSMPR